jgi:hypothetical protein
LIKALPRSLLKGDIRNRERIAFWSATRGGNIRLRLRAFGSSCAPIETFYTGCVSDESKEKEPDLTPPKKFAKWLDDTWDLLKKRPVVGFLFVTAFLIFVALPTCFGLWEKYKEVPELREKLEKSAKEISNLNHQRDDLTRERDNAQSRLMPFLAVAEARFTNAPPDKRLDVLCSKLDSILGKLPKSRVLSREDLEVVKIAFSKLDKSMTITVGYVDGAPEGKKAALQLSDMLQELKFQNLGFERAMILWAEAILSAHH